MKSLESNEASANNRLINQRKKHEWISNPYILWAYCLVLSFTFLFLCTRSSPFYPFNDWADSNAFFTMGKGMMHGKVLYRDLFEQKGPLLYLIHGVAYFISNRTFFGVYIFEGLSFMLFLFYSHKIIVRFVSPVYSFVALPLLAGLILNLKSFRYGDSAEEFIIPFVAMSLYYLIVYFKDHYPNPIRYQTLLINGMIAGCVLWIKYSLLGFWMGWVLTISLVMLIKKQYKHTLLGAIVFLAGMFLVTLPWLIYFGVTHSIHDWIYTYILVNAKFYPVKLKWSHRLLFDAHMIIRHLIHSPVYGAVTVLGLWFFLSKRYLTSSIAKIGIIVCAMILSLGVYGGGLDRKYYFFVFAPFVLFGVIVILDVLAQLLKNRMSIIVSPLALIGALALTYHSNHNIAFASFQKPGLVQDQFASVMDQVKHPTMLNYGVLDQGFYTASGIVPTQKYFENQNIPYSKFPVIMDSQNKCVRQARVDFVVTRGNLRHIKKGVPNLYKNYRLVRHREQKGYMYALFEKRTLLKSKS